MTVSTSSTSSVPSASLASLARRRPGLLEKSFIVFGFLFFSNAFLVLFLKEELYSTDADKTNYFFLIVQTLIFLVTLILAAKNWKSTRRIAIRDHWLLALLGLVLLSCAWSPAPGLTLRRGLVLYLTTIFAFYFAARFSLREQFDLLTVTIVILAIASVVVALLFPDYGIMTGDLQGQWRGIFPHKNALGRMMVLGSIIFSTRLRSNCSRFWNLSGFVLCTILIFLSTSKTAELLWLLFLLLIPIAHLFQLRARQLVGMIAVVVPLTWLSLAWAVDHMDRIFDLLGRDPTLTGRGILWFLVLRKGVTRSWLGYGYNGFWRGLDGDSGDIWRAMGWATPNAHNGFLDLWLMLGFVGLGLFLFSYLGSVIRAARLCRFRQSPLAFWIFLYLIFLVLYNLDETALVQHNNLYWILYATMAVSLRQEERNIGRVQAVPEMPGQLARARRRATAYSQASDAG